MPLNLSRLRVSTKSLLAALVCVGSYVTSPAGSEIIKLHPKLAGIASVVGSVFALLHNPEVQDALGIKTTITQEEVQIANKGEK